MDKSTEINFIGIGAQKSGTSWLFSNLNKLPDFTLLPIKELHYFDRSFKYPSSSALMSHSVIEKIKNPDWEFKFKLEVLRKLKRRDFSDIKWKLRYFFFKCSDKWYLSLFENYRGIKGEVTPSYSMLEIPDIQKMYDVAPDAKLILILRNPIYRAWSHYLHEWRKVKNYSNKEINSKIAIQFMNSKKQMLRSDYERTINNYLSVYPKSQLMIGFHDAIKENPKELIESVINFIGGDAIDISEYLDLRKKINVNPKIKMPSGVFDFLKLKYQGSIERMAGHYNGYFTVWLNEIYGSGEIKENRPSATMIF